MADTMADIGAACRDRTRRDERGRRHVCSGSPRRAARSKATGATSRNRRTQPPPWRRASASLEATARATALEMGYGFLLDPERKLLSIGYRVPEGTLDPSCYDLLASEARLASFIAIAKGDVPARHWFHLGRAVTPIANGAALISWSGSMFEYLMPSLVMRAPAGSLIEQTSRLIVRRQIAYGKALGLPWGVSESAYNARDLEFTYQYSNFGVPGLGLKRGLGENAVVAPYATALATMVDPAGGGAQLRAASTASGHAAATASTRRWTTRRAACLKGETVAIVRAYMAHHQGMTIVAIADALLDGAMRARFHAEPMVQATELLLQERTPRDVAAVRPWAADAQSDAQGAARSEPPGGRRLTTAHTAAPATHLLSNGRYAVMLTAAGSGLQPLAGPGRDPLARGCHLRRLGLVSFSCGTSQRRGVVGRLPAERRRTRSRMRSIFNEDRAEFTRRDRTLTTTMEVLVSAEDDAEVRRVSITNHGNRAREIDVTSYAELVLGVQADDVAHPAFMKLFVGDRISRRSGCDPGDAAAAVAGRPGNLGRASGSRRWRHCRGSRKWKPTGPGSSAAATASARRFRCIDGRPLSNTVGTVLDPIFALRRRVRVAPGGIARIAFWTVVAASREAVLDLVDKHRDSFAFERAATLAWTQAQVQLHHLGIDAGEASLFQRVAGHLLYAGPAIAAILRHDPAWRAASSPGFGPWVFPATCRSSCCASPTSRHLDLARQLLQAHEYWRMKQLAVDLVILNERASSYVQDLQIALETLVRTSQSPPPCDGGRQQPGRVFVLRADLISAETRALLASVARVVLVGQRGALADQLDRVPAPEPLPEPAERARAIAARRPNLRPRLSRWRPRGRRSSFSTGSAASPRTGGNMSRPSAPASRRRRPGSTSSPIRLSAFRWRPKAAATPGRSTAARTSSHPGPTIRSAIAQARRFMCATRRPGELWCPTALPIRRDSRDLCGPAWLGLQPFRA